MVSLRRQRRRTIGIPRTGALPALSIVAVYAPLPTETFFKTSRLPLINAQALVPFNLGTSCPNTQLKLERERRTTDLASGAEPTDGVLFGVSRRMDRPRASPPKVHRPRDHRIGPAD